MEEPSYIMKHAPSADTIPSVTQTKMTLFDLKTEEREVVYAACFNFPKSEVRPSFKTVKPSDDKTVQKHHGASSLLLTCQQIYTEASAHLYQHYTFVFSDDPTSRKSHHLDMSNNCNFCNKLRKQYRGGVRGELEFDICETFSKNRQAHHIVPKCDFLYANSWLTRIGPRNRAHITRIRIHITSRMYTTFLAPGTYGNPACSRDTISFAGGEFLRAVIQNLAKATYIRSLHISIDGYFTAGPYMLEAGDKTKASLDLDNTYLVLKKLLLPDKPLRHAICSLRNLTELTIMDRHGQHLHALDNADDSEQQLIDCYGEVLSLVTLHNKHKEGMRIEQLKIRWQEESIDQGGVLENAGLTEVLEDLRMNDDHGFVEVHQKQMGKAKSKR